MISTDYQEMLSRIHSGTKFGKRSKIPEHLKKFISKQAIRSMIDFGCGKGQLIDVLKHNYPTIDITGYDPANPKFDVPLKKVDLIFSTDVLEHIAPEHLDAKLEEIKDRIKKNIQNSNLFKSKEFTKELEKVYLEIFNENILN